MGKAEAKAQAQAQAQAQKNNEYGVVLKSAVDALVTMSGVQFGKNIVAEGAETTIDSNGDMAYVVTTKDKDGADVTLSYTPTKRGAIWDTEAFQNSARISRACPALPRGSMRALVTGFCLFRKMEKRLTCGQSFSSLFPSRT